MERGLGENSLLDSVTFYTKVHQNRFDVIISSKGTTEKIASGVLDQLVFYLPGLNENRLRGPSDCFKLELTKAVKDVSWFTKSTISCFLSLVSAPELLKSATLIENEISQLEHARNFHLSLYAKDSANVSGDVPIEIGNTVEPDLMPRVQSDTSSDPTKNELLRALELRLSALKKELSTSFGQAMGSVPSSNRLSDLTSFCVYFGAVKMRDHLVRCLESLPKEESLTAMENESLDKPEKKAPGVTSQPDWQSENLKIARTSSALAKMAQAERQISSESEDSDLSDADKPSAERSRPLIRAASPRRSASPMRRVQIGRSGSRRPAALTIRSLNYFPPREKTLSKDINNDGNSSSDEEQDKLPNRAEASARRMSVQDRINLFESKQRDQSLTGQNCRSSTEAWFSTNKPVLRRWSSGMCESSKQGPQAADSANTALSAEEEKNVPVEPKGEADVSVANPDISINLTPSHAMESSHVDLLAQEAEETQEKVTDPSEWTKKKEAELNQMLIKFMETKPSKYGNNGPPSSQKRRDLATKQPKEKVEAVKKLTEKGTVHSRITQETNSQRKIKTVTRAAGSPGKADALVQSQKPRRNSSPPVLSKKDLPKSTVARKPPPKSMLLASLPRSSLTPAPSPRAAGTPLKPQRTLSPSTPVPKIERTPRPSKNGTLASNEAKKMPPNGLEDRKQSSANSSKGLKSKVLAPSGNEAGVVSAKPRLQNKAPKKSSIVPLDSKPALKKVGSAASLTVKQHPRSNGSSKVNVNLVPKEEKETAVETSKSISRLSDDHVSVETRNPNPDHDAIKLDGDLIPDKVESIQVDDSAIKSAEVNVEENLQNEGQGISSAAWVEVDQVERVHESDDSPTCQMAASDLEQPVAPSSFRPRNSLSQMLQAENGELEVLEWGNAENPPALVYQKDAPKGFKRLLKFARKSKGEVNLSDRSSPSVFSDGEEDADDVKVNGKRGSDALQRKVTLQPNVSAKQKNMLLESYTGGHTENGSVDFSDAHETLPGQRPSQNSRKLREGQPNKATRSFFSLSTFRSSKTGDSKAR